MLARLLDQFSMFPSMQKSGYAFCINNVKNPSIKGCFAEHVGEVNSLETVYDAALYEIFSHVEFSGTQYAWLNPPLQDEVDIYQKGKEILDVLRRRNMLLRNSHLLSRLFLKNAVLNKNIPKFSDKSIVNILEVGCGPALSLPGIAAYFGGLSRINYVGIDIDEPFLNDAKKVFTRLSNNINFVHGDADHLLTAAENYERFDVILFQHPNLSESEKIQNEFIELFNNAEKTLSINGIIYITFYFKMEVDFFIEYIQPSLSSKIEFNVVNHSNNYKKPFLGKIPVTKEKNASYVPDNFILTSKPKCKLTKEAVQTPTLYKKISI